MGERLSKALGLSGCYGRAQLKIKDFHEGRKVIENADCAFRALLFMEKVLL